MRTNTPILFALLLAGASLAAACGDGSNDDGQSAGEHTISTFDELRFDPDTLEVPAGEQIQIIIDNSESLGLHDFTIREIPVSHVSADGADHAHGSDPGDAALHVAAESGEKATITFTVDEPGTYEYFCSVPGHADAGMTGSLTAT